MQMMQKLCFKSPVLEQSISLCVQHKIHFLDGAFPELILPALSSQMNNVPSSCQLETKGGK
jgi:hypothetical protein